MRNLAARAAMMAKTASLPYDAQIEYLQSTGKQVVMSGVMTKFNTMMQAKLNVVTFGGDDGFFSAKSSGDTRFLMCTLLSASLRAVFVTCNTSSGLADIRADSAFTVGQDFEVETYISKTKRYIKINGDQKTGSSSTIGTLSANFELPIFARFWNSPTSYSGFTNLKCYYMKVYQDDVLIRDFIPVRVGQVGYLYDKVDGELHGDILGTESFTLGPDV